MKVHIFKGKNGVHGFTPDAAGANLPVQHGPWKPSQTLDMERGEPPRIAVSTDEALDDIDEHGFHLARPTITTTISTSGDPAP